MSDEISNHSWSCWNSSVGKMINTHSKTGHDSTQYPAIFECHRYDTMCEPEGLFN